MDLVLKRFIIQNLRRATYKWPARNQALVNARVGRNQYKCAMCNKIFTRKEVQIDHIVPVVKITGFTTFDEYIERMFCDVNGFQILDEECHTKKTWGEDAQRNNPYGKKRKRTKKRKVIRKNVKVK